MVWAKCRDCQYRCRCCASHFFDKRPGCSGCENHYDEFYPAEHIKFCPIDGKPVRLPMYDILKGELNDH
jgi:hypothetical protein